MYTNLMTLDSTKLGKTCNLLPNRKMNKNVERIFFSFKFTTLDFGEECFLTCKDLIVKFKTWT